MLHVHTQLFVSPPAQQWAGEAVISVGNDIHQHAVGCTFSGTSLPADP